MSHAGECSRKRRYTTRPAAIKALRQSQKAFHKPFRAYHRPWCHLWHLTTMTLAQTTARHHDHA